jgi:hypothetical protein
MSATQTIPATEIVKGDTVTLPSGRTCRIQRVSVRGGITEVIFPDPFEGHVWLTAGTLVERA